MLASFNLTNIGRRSYRLAYRVVRISYYRFQTRPAGCGAGLDNILRIAFLAQPLSQVYYAKMKQNLSIFIKKQLTWSNILFVFILRYVHCTIGAAGDY